MVTETDSVRKRKEAKKSTMFELKTIIYFRFKRRRLCSSLPNIMNTESCMFQIKSCKQRVG